MAVRHPLVAARPGDPLTAQASAGRSPDGGAAEAERVLGHAFANPDLLNEALTHASATGSRASPRERRKRNNERLEFLGDRVLGLVIAELLFALFPNEPEGILTRRLVSLVRAETLTRIAQDLGVGGWLILPSGRSDTLSRDHANMLADALEALIGAVYLDGGLDPAARFIRAHWGELARTHIATPRDPKTALQEWAQARGLPLPAYRVVASSGPSHAPAFAIEASVGDSEPVQAAGASKKAAEQAAAEELLRRLQETTGE